MTSPAIPDPQHLRASDSDRERVADVLREAAGDGRLTMDELDERLDAVYKAKTYAELAPITHDLPDAAARTAPVPASTTPRDPQRFGGAPTSAGAVAIMSGFTRRGSWVVPKDFTAFCLMGGGEIDLRNAKFAEREVAIHVIAIMGGAEIIVPDDATVRVTGVGVMGAFEHTSGGEVGTPDGPVITINGVALMGGVEVKRQPLREIMEQRRDDRRAARHAYRAQRRATRRGY
jgi:hypothetical protein